MARADYLKQRAEDFLTDARLDIEQGRYNLAAFHLEQVCQFYLKYYIFLKLADFTKTHDLRELLDELGKAYNLEQDIARFKADKESELADLNQAYITARYLPVEFGKNQVQRLSQFTQELIDFLSNLGRV